MSPPSIIHDQQVVARPSGCCDVPIITDKYHQKTK